MMASEQQRPRPAVPRFSVIVPAYNSAAFIGETVQSVLDQTATDWELVVVDDGSIDGTGDVVRRYANDRIRLMSQANAGAQSTRQRGFSESLGELIVFLDGDDRLHPQALQRFGESLAAHPEAGVVYGERAYITEAGLTLTTGAVLGKRPSGDVLTHVLRRQPITTPGQACILRGFVEQVGGWPCQAQMSTDWLLWCRLAARGTFIYMGPEPVIDYRIRRGSAARRLASGDPGPHIAESVPTIEAVFSDLEIMRRYGARARRALRRKSEATQYAFKGRTHLSARRWRHARAYLWAALRRDPLRWREGVLLLLCLMRWLPPAIQRSLGTTEISP